MVDQEKTKFYVTTPIYYVNDDPHIGHAYTTLAADIIARFHRLLGQDVFFLTGTDEHGKKLEIAASEAKKTPQEFVDIVVEKFKKMNADLNISNDHFVRTTDGYHVDFCKVIYNRMKDNGDIYKGFYEGLYCIGCEKFIREIDLEDGKCPLHKKKPEKMKEETYFFRMSRYEKQLLTFFEENPGFISPSIWQQEIINRVKGGLEDLSISRASIKWGIPLPDDPNHVMYVWIDALSNYISALDYPGKKFKRYWPADVHLIGKDIKWFHMVIWPAMLMSAKIPLPKKVFAHGFWTVDGTKMSKSLKNVVRPGKMKEKYGVDEFRYYLFSKAQFGQDNDFSEKQLVEVLNTELADDLGNLVNRIVVLIQKYFKGIIPVPAPGWEEEKDIEKKFNIRAEIKEYFLKFEFSKALKALWEKLRWMNKFITDTEPWVLFKENKMDTLESVLFCLAEGLRLISILLSPVMPATCERIFEVFRLQDQDYDAATWRNDKSFKEGTTLKDKKLILFKKKEYIQEKEEKTMDEGKLPEIKDEITYEDFLKLDMRSAKILAAEPVPKADKLVKLSVECGPEKRTVVAGIAQHYTVDELVGKNIIILVNLKPRKIRGILSEGMLLAVDLEDHRPVLLVPDKDVKSGYPVS
ncbi:MAG: methionine--tRNA ligase [Promethearchaeota archaeon]